VMAVVFLATAAMLAPAADALLRGLLLPTIPDDGGAGLAVAVGLIGTTVVPYNLFLHASAVREKWGGADDGAGGHAHAGRVGDGAARPGSLRAARLDLTISIVLGGVVTAAIVVTSAAMRAEGAAAGVSDAAEMAVQLEPLLGSRARILFAIGLLAAGVTSATTAPLAAAYATAGALGWPRDLRHPRSRLVWIAVLGAGVLFALTGVRPVPAILFAQVANGVLLPAIAVFLILAANDRRWMGRWANGPVLNALGGLVVLVALVLGVRAVLGAL
ncbi:MAG: NRAMP family divalent metal transporter, partial [Gemmatimonadota bacterium]